jgi:hypothetical protein
MVHLFEGRQGYEELTYARPVASGKVQLPVTRLHTEYLGLLHKTQEERLSRAQSLGADEVSAMFVESVEVMGSVRATAGTSWLSFYPHDRVALENRANVGGTRIAKRLHAAPGQLHPVEGSTLSLRYIDRELVALRYPGAVFGSAELKGKTTRAAPRLDLLLESGDDRPIVAEVKVANDKDPYFGLIQALMHTAHLATSNQVERLRNVRLSHPFEGKPGLPFDVYVILENFDPLRGRHRPALYEHAQTLARGLVASGDEFPRAVRTVACIEATVGGNQGISFKCMWQAA